MEESEQLFSGVAMTGMLDVDPTGSFGSLGLDAIGHSFLSDSLLSSQDPVLIQGSDAIASPLPDAVDTLLGRERDQEEHSESHDQVRRLDPLDHVPVDHLEHLEQDLLEQSEPFRQDLLQFSEPLGQDQVFHSEPLRNDQVGFSEPLEQDDEDDVYHSEPFQKDQVGFPDPIEQDDMFHSEPLQQGEGEQLEPLPKDQVRYLEPIERGQLEQSEPSPWDQVEQSEPQVEHLSPLHWDQVEQSEPQVENLEPLHRDQVEQSEPQVENLEPLHRDQVEQSEPQVENLKPLHQDQVEQSEPQVENSELLHRDQVEQSEPQVENSEPLHRDQVEQLEPQVEHSEPLHQEQMELSEPQVDSSEPLHLDQVKQSDVENVPERSEPPDQAQAVESPEPGSPTNMELEDTSKDGAEEDPAVVLEVPFPVEFEKFYRVVEENPEDFTGWTYLLQHVEQENHIGAARKAFDSFFSRYPYCYGYWKKYADMEKRLDSMSMADEVYRCGLQAIPLSVDLWLHFVTFLRETLDANDGNTETRVRAAYEHAVLAAGTDFRSDRLWESYITWEEELGNLAHMTAIYDRILGIPTQLYSHHFQRFKEHVQNNLPKHFLSQEEFVQLRVELANVGALGVEEAMPTEELPSGTEDLADPAKRVTEVENMRHRVVEARQEVFNHNEHEVSKRWTFEEGIKRPYFHVKALEKAQLANWKEYLDFEIENGTPERVVVLFERCLVACALYEEFWIKYAKYLENYSIEGVRHVYRKACTIHLPKKPTLHLLWAGFEEQQGNIAEARGILKALEETVPGLAMVRLRRVSLERRHGNMEEAESLLQDAIGNGKDTGESSFYSIKLARQLLKVQRSLERARKVLLEAIERDKTSPKLYLNLLELEYSGDVKQNEEQILSCFDRALSSPLPLESRLAFSQRKVEFLEDFGTDINMLVYAYEEHQKLSQAHESTKRKAENGSQEPEPKKARTDDPSMTTGHMMPDMLPNHSAYNNYNYNWYQQYNYQNPWGYGQYYPPPPT